MLTVFVEKKVREETRRSILKNSPKVNQYCDSFSGIEKAARRLLIFNGSQELYCTLSSTLKQSARQKWQGELERRQNWYSLQSCYSWELIYLSDSAAATNSCRPWKFQVCEIASRMTTRETLTTECFLVLTLPASCKTEFQVQTTAQDWRQNVSLFLLRQQAARRNFIY